MNVSFEAIEKFGKSLPLWSILSFTILTIGFVGFFTFCSLNNIPINEPTIYTLLGFGVFNGIYWILIIFSALKNGYWVFRSILLIGFLNWLTFDPIIWGGLTLFYLLIYSNSFKNESTVSSETRKESFIGKIARKLKISEHYLKTFIDFSPLFLILTLELWYETSIPLSTFIFVTFYLIRETSLVLKHREINLYHIFISIILIPSFLSFSIINRVDFSLVGISKLEVDVQSKEGYTRGIIIFQDRENIYLKSNTTSDTTLIFPKSEIINTKVIKKISSPFFLKKLNSNPK